MAICDHGLFEQKEKIIRKKVVCERGNQEFEFCSICGQLTNIFPSRKLYNANYQEHHEVRDAQKLRKEHQKTTGTHY